MAELNAALVLDTRARNGNINLSKYFISFSEDRTHNQSVLQSHFVPLRHDWPQFIYIETTTLYIETQNTYLRYYNVNHTLKEILNQKRIEHVQDKPLAS